MTSTHTGTMLDLDERLGGLFSENEDESLDLNERDRDRQRQARTDILEHFDMNPVPLRVENPLKEKKRTDGLSVTIAKLLSFINIGMLILGICALVMAIVRGKVR